MGYSGRAVLFFLVVPLAAGCTIQRQPEAPLQQAEPTYYENYFGNPTRYRILPRVDGNALVIHLEPGPCEVVTVVRNDLMPVGPCQFRLLRVPVRATVAGIGTCEMVTDENGSAVCELPNEAFGAQYGIASLTVEGLDAGVISIRRAPTAEAVAAPAPQGNRQTDQGQTLTDQDKAALALAICAVKLWGEERCIQYAGAATCNAIAQWMSKSPGIDWQQMLGAEIKDRVAKKSETLGALIGIAEFAQCLQELGVLT
ncbi:MAG TPA: hypothetical protein VIV60_10115 [Polyangiaceae bacterium]